MVKLYSTGCPKCNILVKKLNSGGIEFEEIKNEEQIIDAAQKRGVMTLPLLDVEDKILTFEEANKWINERV